jgi:cephalosporin hydroxylase
MSDSVGRGVRDDNHTDYQSAKARAAASMQRGVWEGRFTERFEPFAKRQQQCDLGRHAIGVLNEGKNFVSYRGIAMAKDPLDMVLYPILFHEIAPKTVIELGAYTGASAMWMADTLAIAGIDARVISIDIDLSLVEPMARNHSDIEFLEGDCNQIEDLLPAEQLRKLPHPFVLVDDAHVNIAGVFSHFHEHCLTTGDYLVIEDTIPWIPGSFGPAETDETPEWGDWKRKAVESFFADHGDDYRVDRYYTDFFGYNGTWNWNGFVRRM